MLCECRSYPTIDHASSLRRSFSAKDIHVAYDLQFGVDALIVTQSRATLTSNNHESKKHRPTPLHQPRHGNTPPASYFVFDYLAEVRV